MLHKGERKPPNKTHFPWQELDTHICLPRLNLGMSNLDLTRTIGQRRPNLPEILGDKGGGASIRQLRIYAVPLIVRNARRAPPPARLLLVLTYGLKPGLLAYQQRYVVAEGFEKFAQSLICFVTCSATKPISAFV